MGDRNVLPILMTLVAAIVLASCSSGTTQEPASTTGAAAAAAISIEDFRFQPPDLTVPVGATVTWTNDEAGIAHTTTADDGTWNSGSLQPGDAFEMTFDQPGTYSYFCSIHPSMQATITVQG